MQNVARFHWKLVVDFNHPRNLPKFPREHLYHANPARAEPEATMSSNRPEPTDSEVTVVQVKKIVREAAGQTGEQGSLSAPRNPSTLSLTSAMQPPATSGCPDICSRVRDCLTNTLGPPGSTLAQGTNFPGCPDFGRRMMDCISNPRGPQDSGTKTSVMPCCPDACRRMMDSLINPQLPLAPGSKVSASLHCRSVSTKCVTVKSCGSLGAVCPDQKPPGDLADIEQGDSKLEVTEIESVTPEDAAKDAQQTVPQPEEPDVKPDEPKDIEKDAVQADVKPVEAEPQPEVPEAVTEEPADVEKDSEQAEPQPEVTETKSEDLAAIEEHIEPTDVQPVTAEKEPEEPEEVVEEPIQVKIVAEIEKVPEVEAPPPPAAEPESSGDVDTTVDLSGIPDSKAGAPLDRCCSTTTVQTVSVTAINTVVTTKSSGCLGAEDADTPPEITEVESDELADVEKDAVEAEAKSEDPGDAVEEPVQETTAAQEAEAPRPMGDAPAEAAARPDDGDRGPGKCSATTLGRGCSSVTVQCVSVASAVVRIAPSGALGADCQPEQAPGTAGSSDGRRRGPLARFARVITTLFKTSNQIHVSTKK